MKSIFENVEVSDNNAVLKMWAKPSFDVISKDVVEGGTASAGKESTSAGVKYS